MGEYRFKINGKQYDVQVNGITQSEATLCVNGEQIRVDIESCLKAASTPSASASARQDSGSISPDAAQQTTPAQGGTITSPLPGVILDICVKERQSVKRGDRLAVLEAMKMENDILAEKDGTVTAIFASKGKSVLEGDKIISIA